jgi:hypothetical protein
MASRSQMHGRTPLFLRRALAIACLTGRVVVFAQDTTSTESRATGSFAPSTPAPRPDRVQIYFPPYPPPLGRIVTLRPPAIIDELVAPAELAPYVSDVFYPSLSTLVATDELKTRQRERLQTYQTTKLALLRELRTELDRARDLKAGEREHALESFARRQAPALAKLEKTADDFRRDFTSYETDWSYYRQWRLGDGDAGGYSPLEIGRVLRAYSYYGNGLLLAQRGMLREISMEMLLASENAERAAAAQPFVFFSPEPARVLFPENIPDDVATKLAAYQNQKAVLKKELYAAVNEAERATLLFRTNPLKTVAQKQSSRLQALEALANEIRRGLAESEHSATAIEPSPLAPELTEKTAALLQEGIDLERSGTTRMEQALAADRYLPVRVGYSVNESGIQYQIVPLGLPGRGRRGANGSGAGESTATLARIEALRERINAIVDDYGRAMADLMNRRDALRAEILAALGTQRLAAVENAIAVVTRILAQRQHASAYADYRTAVFEVGLSAEQRRLLFDAAIVQLNLPPLRGELQPMERAETW